jgi:retron-type reverse transcriptase
MSRLSDTGLTVPSLMSEQLSDGSGSPTGPKDKVKNKLALEVRKRKTLDRAWAAIQRNARHSKSEATRKEIEQFSQDANKNISRIYRSLKDKKFIFPPARGVKIPKDKNNKKDFRPLVVAQVESRIVQRAIHDVIVKVTEINKYVKTPHSFGGIQKSRDDELSAVPAAVKAVLDAIENGGKFIIRSDISKFFTKISKQTVTDIIESTVDDIEFLDLFKRAITVELANMAQLASAASSFPIYDVGVAQGNSLSPLMGNLILNNFDAELNKKQDVRCIRYIDDFIIIAPSREVAENTFSVAKQILKTLGMDVSASKTQYASIKETFEFLGIEFSNGLLRPGRKSRERVVLSISNALTESIKAFINYSKTRQMDDKLSLIETMSRVSGIMQGWGKHYYFCNDQKCFEHLDSIVEGKLKQYLGVYRNERGKADDTGRWLLLGIQALSQIERKPFLWPKKKHIHAQPDPVPAPEALELIIELDSPPW